MNMKTWVAASVIAAFATPFPVGAAGDKASSASAGSSGAAQTFQSLDKNKDGFLSKDEVKGTPHDKDFAKLDKNNDGKLAREEHAGAEEKTATGATGGGAASSGAAGSSGGAAQGKKY